MIEEEEIKFSTLHLEGEAHEWWYHGLVTLGHTNITSYVNITHSLMDRFDKKDNRDTLQGVGTTESDIGTPDAYITEFQRMAVILT
jgi:hypothetical protein